MANVPQLADSLQSGPPAELVDSGGYRDPLIRSYSCRERTERDNAGEEKRLHAFSSNEKEISHGRVWWQTRETYFGMGPLASSIG
jgi:hypothetical protein